MGEDFGIGYAMGQDSNGGGGGNNGGLFGGNNDWLGIILLIALLGGGFGGRGFGGGGGGMMGGGGGYGGCGLVTTADLCGQFNFNNLENSVRGIQQGICDSTFALNNAIMSGFHGVDNAVCTLGYQAQQGFNTLGYQVQQGFNTLGYQQKDCCCETQRLIERGFCDTNYNLATNTANIVNAGHADTDRVIAKLDAMENARQAEKIEALRMENQTLRFQASQANQNAFITANQEAQTAELIRRLSTPCPVPAYVVPNPNCCYGNPLGVGYNNYGGNGCGCGCAA